jgi:hypothetical protein
MEEGRDLTALHDGDDNEDTGEDENNVEYVPAWIKGGVPHPGHVVQSTAMAVTEPPPITYRIRLPRRLIESGALSLLQVEAALYCMQMHEKRLPTGERAGWMLGDGTGIGKGRILSAIMYENLLRGTTPALSALLGSVGAGFRGLVECARVGTRPQAQLLPRLIIRKHRGGGLESGRARCDGLRVSLAVGAQSRHSSHPFTF